MLTVAVEDKKKLHSFSPATEHTSSRHQRKHVYLKKIYVFFKFCSTDVLPQIWPVQI